MIISSLPSHFVVLGCIVVWCVPDEGPSGGSLETGMSAAGGVAMAMTGDTTEELQGLIDRRRRGDDTGCAELMVCAYHRLRRIASAMFHRDFPGLKDRHDLESVVDESWARLMRD